MVQDTNRNFMLQCLRPIVPVRDYPPLASPQGVMSRTGCICGVEGVSGCIALQFPLGPTSHCHMIAERVVTYNTVVQ